MNSNIADAKKRLLPNIAWNVAYVATSALFILLMTPYLIEKLGIELYGMIPLIIAFISYLNILTMSITGSVNRFVTLHYHQGGYETSNIYLNSAFWALAGACFVILLPIVYLSAHLDKLINIPTSYETDVAYLCFFILAGALITTITSPLVTATFIKHRFDLDSGIKISGKLAQVAFLIAIYEFAKPSVAQYGVSYLLMSLIMLILYYLFMKKLTPELQLHPRLYRKSAIRDMGTMGLWQIVDQVGALFYVTSSILMINVFLGAEQGGKYAAIAQWATLVGVLGAAICNVFSPIAYEYIARGEISTLARQIQRSLRYTTVAMGLPIGLVCGFAAPILTWWLGKGYEDLAPIMWLLVAPWIIHIGIRPMFAIFAGLNKVVVPAVVTLTIGIVNILLIYLFIEYLGLGLYAVCYALIICMAGKNIFFTPVYAARITGQPYVAYVKPLLLGTAFSIGCSFICFWISQTQQIEGLIALVLWSIPVSVGYCTIAYLSFTDPTDKALIGKLLGSLLLPKTKLWRW